MVELDEDTIAILCISKWGENEQIRQTIEECAELIVELSKKDRVINGSSEDDICNELADVEIMLNQMRHIYDGKQIDKIKNRKLKKLNKRVSS